MGLSFSKSDPYSIPSSQNKRHDSNDDILAERNHGPERQSYIERFVPSKVEIRQKLVHQVVKNNSDNELDLVKNIRLVGEEKRVICEELQISGPKFNQKVPF